MYNILIIQRRTSVCSIRGIELLNASNILNLPIYIILRALEGNMTLRIAITAHKLSKLGGQRIMLFKLSEILFENRYFFKELLILLLRVGKVVVKLRNPLLKF